MRKPEYGGPNMVVAAVSSIIFTVKFPAHTSRGLQPLLATYKSNLNPDKAQRSGAIIDASHCRNMLGRGG